MEKRFYRLDNEYLLSPDEVALLFKVHYSTVIQWAKKRKLRSVRISNCLRFRENDVHRFIRKYAKKIK